MKTEPLAEFLSSKCYHDTIQVSCLGFLPTYFRFDVDYSEEMVHYLVLRLERPLDQERFLRVLDEYLRQTTLYDYAYRLDNDDEDARRLYCSEFVWRVLKMRPARSWAGGPGQRADDRKHQGNRKNPVQPSGPQCHPAAVWL